jgi:hypothetical protein
LPFCRLKCICTSLVLIGVFIAPVSNVWAQIQTSGFSVLQLDASARSAALAGSTTALRESNGSVLFSNPALLTPRADRRLAFSYLNHISNINAGWLSYARQLDSLGTVAVGLRYLSFGSFDELDQQGVKTGTFGASDIAISIGAARSWRNVWSYGAALHLTRSAIASNSASATAIDAGIVYDNPTSRSTFSASVHNLGIVLSSVGTRADKLPLDFRIGLTQKLAYLPLLISITAYRLHELDGGDPENGSFSAVLNHVKLAGEFQFSESFQVRFGYDHRKHQDLKIKSRLDMAGFSTGLGLVIAKIGFDYSFNSWSSLGSLHRFSIVSSL